MRALKTKKAESGISLIEVLVTIVILSFGLLGVAGLLVGGVTNAAASEFNTKAEQLISDMAERMRVNSAEVITASSLYSRSYTDAGPSSPSSSVATQDVDTWIKAIASQLPSGQGKIEVDANGTNRIVKISIRWNVCLGALTQSQAADCGNNPESTYKSVTQELRL
jgi:type IV pilus assembly protein PilV